MVKSEQVITPQGITPLFVANNILSRSFAESLPISTMKLQKLTYFIYRDYLQTTRHSLFGERFAVWKYGPVLLTIQHEFQRFRDGSIGAFYRNHQKDVYLVTENGVLKKILDDNWQRYRDVNGIYLAKITQRPNSAWRTAFDLNLPFLSDEHISIDMQR